MNNKVLTIEITPEIEQAFHSWMDSPIDWDMIGNPITVGSRGARSVIDFAAGYQFAMNAQKNNQSNKPIGATTRSCQANIASYVDMVVIDAFNDFLPGSNCSSIADCERLFEDSNLDSLDVVEMVIMIEDKFNVTVNEEYVDTFADFYNSVLKAFSKNVNPQDDKTKTQKPIVKDADDVAMYILKGFLRTQIAPNHMLLDKQQGLTKRECIDLIDSNTVDEYDLTELIFDIEEHHGVQINLNIGFSKPTGESVYEAISLALESVV